MAELNLDKQICEFVPDKQFCILYDLYIIYINIFIYVYIYICIFYLLF